MDNNLYHHGIKGMKWGVRRFQNKDGSLTNAGKERYCSRATLRYEKKGLSEKAARSAELDKKIYDIKSAESTGKKIGLTLLMGVAGKWSYDTIRAAESSKGKAAVTAMLGGPLAAAKIRRNYVEQGNKSENTSTTSSNVSIKTSDVTSKTKPISKHQAKKDYANIYNMVADRMNTSGELQKLNDRYEGRYNSEEYVNAYNNLNAKMFEEERKKYYNR